MSIKYNEFGEVAFVNGLATGQHLGTPMQDAIAAKPEDNEVYAEERNTVTRVSNSENNWDNQPTVVHHLDPKYIKDMYYDTTTEVLSGDVWDIQQSVASGYDGCFMLTESNCSPSILEHIDNCPAQKEYLCADVTINDETKRFYYVYEESWTSDYGPNRLVFIGPEAGAPVVKFTFNSDKTHPYDPYGYSMALGSYQISQHFSVSDVKDITNVSVVVYDGEIRKIPDKYLPNGSTMFYYNLDLDNYIYKDTYCCDYAYRKDIDEAVNKGAMYISDMGSGTVYHVTYIERGEKGYAVHYYTSEDKYIGTEDFMPKQS